MCSPVFSHTKLVCCLAIALCLLLSPSSASLCSPRSSVTTASSFSDSPAPSQTRETSGHGSPVRSDDDGDRRRVVRGCTACSNPWTETLARACRGGPLAIANWERPFACLPIWSGSGNDSRHYQTKRKNKSMVVVNCARSSPRSRSSLNSAPGVWLLRFEYRLLTRRASFICCSLRATPASTWKI